MNINTFWMERSNKYFQTFFQLQSTLNISNSEEAGKNVRDSQSWRYRETGLKQNI